MTTSWGALVDLNLLLTHWPFVAAFGIFYVIGRTMKNGPLSAENAAQYTWVRLVRRWFPLPLHPIVAGLVLGLMPGVPVTVEVGANAWGPMLYFAGAGVLSVVWHDLFNEWKKHKPEPAQD